MTTPGAPPTVSPNTTANFYTVLGIETYASAADIRAAYERQCALYDPAHGATMGDDFAREAAERRIEIEQAYATLSEPHRRFDYDQQQGLVGSEAVDRRGVSNRDVIWTIMGVIIGLLLLSLIYNITSKHTDQGGITDRFTVVNYPAKAIALRTLNGSRFDLQAQRGKVVIVNFWGTWCEPCKEETPALQTAYTKLHDQGLMIVGVNMFADERNQYGHTEGHVQAFTQQYGVTYPIALDDVGSVTRDYQLYNIPVSFIVDPDGNVRYIRTGAMTVNDAEQMLRLLKRS